MQKVIILKIHLNSNLSTADFLTAADLDRPEHTIVLNTDAFDKLYSSWEPNLYIDIKGTPYKVVGVYSVKSNDGWHDI